MTRYIMPIRSTVNAFMQRTIAAQQHDDVHRWVFVRDLAPDTEGIVRKWLVTGLNPCYCDLQVMYIPHLAGLTQARTHIVLNNTPPLNTLASADEAVEVDARGLNTLDAVKATIKATGLNPHMSVCGWPFCLDGLDDANTEGDAAWHS